MTFKHTPGPWMVTRYHRSPASIEAVRGDGDALAKVYLTDPKTRRRTPEYEANATLMAAAPELANALRAIYNIALQDNGKWSRTYLETVREALALLGRDEV
jgi:hypothetical protein